MIDEKAHAMCDVAHVIGCMLRTVQEASDIAMIDVEALIRAYPNRSSSATGLLGQALILLIVYVVSSTSLSL
jgi:hypothetical protein